MTKDQWRWNKMTGKKYIYHRQEEHIYAGCNNLWNWYGLLCILMVCICIRFGCLSIQLRQWTKYIYWTSLASELCCCCCCCFDFSFDWRFSMAHIIIEIVLCQKHQWTMANLFRYGLWVKKCAGVCVVLSENGLVSSDPYRGIRSL